MTAGGDGAGGRLHCINRWLLVLMVLSSPKAEVDQCSIQPLENSREPVQATASFSKIYPAQSLLEEFIRGFKWMSRGSTLRPIADFCCRGAQRSN
jgi:hypothetical protein